MVDTKRLQGTIISSGYTQSTLAKKIGIGENTLSLKINNKGFFDTNEIEKICVVLGITSAKDKVDIFLLESSHYCND